MRKFAKTFQIKNLLFDDFNYFYIATFTSRISPAKDGNYITGNYVSIL